MCPTCKPQEDAMIEVVSLDEQPTDDIHIPVDIHHGEDIKIAKPFTKFENQLIDFAITPDNTKVSVHRPCPTTEDIADLIRLHRLDFGMIADMMRTKDETHITNTTMEKVWLECFQSRHLNNKYACDMI